MAAPGVPTLPSATRRPAGALGTFWGSTIGKKVVMAVSGLIMVGFVVGHVFGNLLVFRGAEQMNHYAAFLKSTGGLLWAVRGVLLASLVLHVVAAVQLTAAQRAARPAAYHRRDPQVSTIASRTIRWGGGLLLAFIIFHLLHFTLGTVHPRFSETDVYSNIVVGFSDWRVSAFYILAMAGLGLHLYHGAWSSLRTLGLHRASAAPLKRRLVLLLAVAVWLGFTAIPVAVLAGLVR
ncbi:MAG: succinate dehydrogenase cytochrome b subunit [Gemmatimonadaceae bacterium]